MKPGAIGIGAQKCMTSWVHALAAAHPGIAASTPKEVDFFSYHFDRGYAWYERHFPDDGRLGFEASPSYLHDPRAPLRAAAYAPDLRILVLLRDPVERAYSNHLHEIAKGHFPNTTFAEGIANNPAYVEQGLYATHLRRWFDHFPRENILCLLVEEIRTDTARAAAMVYQFLGVDPDHRSGVIDERRNESDRARLPALRTVLRAGGDTARRLGLEESLLRIKRAPGIARMLKANSIPLRDEVPPPALDDIARLRAIFAPEVEALAKLLGRDALPWPGYETRVAGADRTAALCAAARM